MNLVAALMMLGPVGNTSVSLEDRLVTVFAVLAGLTGVATLIQVGGGSEKNKFGKVCLKRMNVWFSSTYVFLS